MIPVYEDLPIDADMQAVGAEEETSKTFRLNESNHRIIGMIDEQEAIRQTIYCILNTVRYQYEMYSEDYGVELKQLIGQPIQLACVNLQDNIKEALLADDRILTVDQFRFQEVRHGTVVVTFEVETIFGTTEIEKEVNLNG